jgi:hypothetical protein
MEIVNKIMNFAELVHNESEKELKLHIKWIDFITSLFQQYFGLGYRHELSSFYSQNAKDFIKQQRKIFNSKYKLKP